MVQIVRTEIYEVRLPDGSTILRTPDPNTAKDWCKENGEQYTWETS